MLRVALVSLAVLVAALPAALTFASAHDPDAPSSIPTVPYTMVGFDDAHLPGETGWFVVPVTVDQPAWVRFESDIFAGNDPARDTTWAILLIAEQLWAPAPILASGTTGSPPLASLSHGGETTTCCADLWASYSWTWGEGPEIVMPMEPGQVMWFGLAVVDWSEWDDVHFEVSGQALVSIGEPRTGARVESVDLYQEALDAGTRVQLGGMDYVTIPGAAERTFTSEGFGILAADAWSWGTPATFTVEVPGEPVLSRELTMDSGAYAVAHRAGTFRVALEDLQKEPLWLAGSSDGLLARAIFVDVDLPGDTAYLYAWPEA